ncbi:AAA family ATPase [Amycolatopsis sp. FDAARGOS 1241]|uniref:AAA family ATPase n=1 Tax=Amycolatopsis sp. FDAARGOS 1241 TaxID=2778070 RepID=UPI001950E80A|nr:AAA family ATPase [Amycolatopsis sp. FDAARGOS 1241]QRP49592.1 AAA family ATPase [Amycolatopsis sp. FDAARGOS 1241]
MSTGDLPGRGPPTRVEILHEDARTRVVRLFLPDGRTVVGKRPLGPEAQRRLRHERAVLERLRGVPGVAQLVAAPRYPGSIVLADAGAANLAGRAEPLPVEVLVGVALGLARAVAAVHRRGVLHRDITPANVVLSRDGTPCLVDFALATSLAESGDRPAERSEIVGTLAYLAPEQTGRTGRPVDRRSDLYALGATLYELATAAPPFGSGDPLRLTHDHLARVPAPPVEVNRALPAPLSEIILHLLEKEPDNRYQTAEGLVHDLERLRDARGGPVTASLRVGEHDFPPGPAAPPRLVERDAEVTALRAAFEDALGGRCRGVLVSGAAGVGKTALVDELRPAVASRGGWFVAGKFDQYRRDLEFDGLYQALRSLGRLLLAEPERELALLRQRISDAVGPNAGLLTAVVPEFAALLGVPPDPGDPLTAQSRAQHNGVQILRAIASPQRPIVLFLDDLQWAGLGPLGFVDLLLDEAPITGLLLVGAYRDEDVDSAQPAAPLSRARTGVQSLRLHNLHVEGQVAMVAEMLRADAVVAASLVEVIAPRTSGNPYETVQLLDSLGREGVLAATGTGWQWDPAAVRAQLGQSEVGDLPAARVEAMPEPSRALVEAMACLGGRAELSLLGTATGEPEGALRRQLAPALDEGLLVAEAGVVRFRHDRIREAILRRLGPQRRSTLQLAMARRLAEVPELFAAAAEQYLPVAGAIGDPAERRQAVHLLCRAADQARLVGDHALVHALLTAALQPADPDATGTRVNLHTGCHSALYSLGRLDEADDEYRTIARLCPSAVQRAGATDLQVRSLTHRKRFAEAIDLGLESLRECGITVPEADRLPAALDAQFDHLYRWLDHTEPADDLTRPELADPPLLAASRLINAVLPPAYFAADAALYAWLGLAAVRMWLEHGPGRTLIGPVSHAAIAVMVLRDDYAAAYRAMRRILELGEARGYDPDTSPVRSAFASVCCWFEPIENAVRAARRAREELIAAGQPAWAGYAYAPGVAGLLECAPSLHGYVADVEAGLAFVRRTGSEQTAQWLDSYRWLAAVLRGESPARAGDPIPIDRYADNPSALVFAHIARAVAAAVFGDPAGLARHTAAAMPLLPATAGFYPSALARLLRGLALAGRARATDGDERAALLTDLDEVTSWLAARAADAPDNFLHLLRLLEAERAWAVGEFRACALAFDTALREAARRQRPWHRALITERAALFHLAHGLDHTGHDLLGQARRHYAAWGATAKVAQLDWAYPTLRPRTETTPGLGGDPPADVVPERSTITTGTLDLLGILSASQALSSETSIGSLHARVVEVLSELTGATAVQLLHWNDDHRGWLPPSPAGDPAVDTGHEHTVPLSVLRYVQRTGEPLVVADATRDDRFARDPCFAGLACCSLLAVPILSRGVLRAALLLENRLIRGAFTTERLDAVKLIAGQLAVSLDNARLYTQLTDSRARIVTAADEARHRIERDLHDGAQQRLISLALRLRAAEAAESGELATDLGELATEAVSVLDELREIARGIHPGILDTAGLEPAVRALGRRSPIPVDLDLHPLPPLPKHVEVSTYFIVAEALTNAAKHSRASTVTVALQANAADDVLHIAVRDDGVGGADLTRGTGLLGLKDRVEAIGGRIVLRSPRGSGTSLQVQLPLAGTTLSTAGERDTGPTLPWG